MKITNIDLFDAIEVKARDMYESRSSKESTYAVLNQVSMWAHEASEMYKLRGLYSLAEHAERISKALYEMMDADGYYDDCR